MLAVRLHGNSDLRVDQVPEPDAVGPGQVRVEPQWCGICGTDLHEYAHGPLYTPAENLPQVIGHEFSAVIAETGPGVTAFRPGDRVAVLPHVFCGSCFYCLRGRQGLCSNLKLTGVTWPWGGLAGQAIVPASQAVPLPDGVSFEQGAVLEPLATVVHGVERSGLRPGDSVLVTGGGPIGQLAVLVAAAAGAGSIFISEPQAARRLMAERNGAAVFDPASADVAGEVAELTGGLGADCAIECSGSQAGLDACVASVRRAATVAVIAIHLGDRLVQPEGWVWRDLTIAGVWSFKIWDTPRILAQIAAGTLPVERVVTSRIGMHDIVRKGIQRLADPGGDQVKILVSAAAQEAAGKEAAGREGANLALFDIEEATLETAAAALRARGYAVETASGDVSRAADVEAAVARTVERFGAIDVLVHTAAVVELTPLLEFPEHLWRRIVDVNLTGVFLTVQAAGRVMAARGGGAIVVFASTNAFFAEESNVPYSATKGGLVMFVRNAAMDLARHRIRINAVDPGIIDTRLSRALVHDPVAGPDYLKRIPAGRYGTAHDIAKVVLFLASDDAGYMTGEDVIIDGGLTLGATLGIEDLGLQDTGDSG